MLVRDLLDKHKVSFTTAERRIVPFLMDDSLVFDIKSITQLAKAANVSNPTIIRLSRKLGFSGYPTLQNAIRKEFAERFKQPLAKIKPIAQSSPGNHIVNIFANQVVENINKTIYQLDYQVFDKVAEMLADQKRNLYLVGGRITRSNAHYFFSYLQIIRPNVNLMNSSRSVWPQTTLDFDESTVLIIFDIRRYEKELKKLASIAVSIGVTIVLFTDQWGSPIERVSLACFRSMIEVQSVWDSTIAINFLIESMLAKVQQKSRFSSTDRIQNMEKIIGETKIFRDSSPKWYKKLR